MAKVNLVAGTNVITKAQFLALKASVDPAAIGSLATPVQARWARNPSNDGPIDSATIRFTQAAPSYTTRPAISGTARQGENLQGELGIWANSPTSFNIRYKRNGAVIAGTEATIAPGDPVVPYKAKALDIDSTITFGVVGVNSSGASVEAISEPTAPVVAATAPTITSAAIINILENAALNHTLTANEPVTWAVTGGADLAKFSLATATLTLPAQNFEDPQDDDANNSYRIQITATSVATEATTTQNISVNVGNVFEAATLTAATFSATGPYPINTVDGTDLATITNLQGATLSITPADGRVTIVGDKIRKAALAWTAGAKSYQIIKSLNDSPNSPLGTAFAFTVAAALSISGTPATSGSLGDTYSFVPTLAGGVGTKTVTLAAGSLPAGVTLNASTGELSGYLGNIGTFTGIRLRVATATETIDLAAFNIVVSVPVSTLALPTSGNTQLSLATELTTVPAGANVTVTNPADSNITFGGIAPGNGGTLTKAAAIAALAATNNAPVASGVGPIQLRWTDAATRPRGVNLSFNITNQSVVGTANRTMQQTETDTPLLLGDIAAIAAIPAGNTVTVTIPADFPIDISIPGELPIQEAYGANTVANAGGFDIDGTIVTQKNAANADVAYFTAAANVCSINAAGVTAVLAGGPFTITTSTAKTYVVTAIPSCHSFRNDAELTALGASGMIATVKGRKLLGRNFTSALTIGGGSTGVNFRRNDYRVGGLNSVTLGSHYTDSNARRFTLGAAINWSWQGMELDGIAFVESITANKITIDDIQSGFPVGDVVIKNVYAPYPARDITTAANASYAANAATFWVNQNFLGSQGGSNISSLTITGCTVRYAKSLMAMGCPGPITIEDNDIGPYLAIGVTIAANSARTSVPISIKRNFFHEPAGRNTDGPVSGSSLHPDVILITGAANMTQDWTAIVIEDNIMIRGTGRGQTGPYVAMRDMTAPSLKYFTAQVNRNRGVGSDGGMVFHIESAKTCTVNDNDFVCRNNPSDLAAGNMAVGDVSSASPNGTVNRNIAESISWGINSNSGNVQLGKAGANNSYLSKYVGPTFEPATKAAAIAALVRI